MLSEQTREPLGYLHASKTIGALGMVTREDLNKLYCRPDRTTNSVLTLYLSVASAKYPHKLQTMLEQLKISIYDHFDAVHLLAAVQKVEEFFSTYQPRGQALTLIFDRTDSFLWVRELQVALGNVVHWGVRPYLRPLAEALDDFPYYAVAVLDKSTLRLFTVALHEIEEYRKPRAGIVNAIQRMIRSKRISHLILAGPPETTTELRHSIPKWLQRMVIDSIHLPHTAEPAEVLQQTLPIAEEFKRKEESEIVRDLTVQPAEGSWAVTGLGKTLDLLNRGHIWQLIYAEGLRGHALQCRQCAAIFSEGCEYCLYCGSSLEAVGNLLDCIRRHSIARGVRVRKLNRNAAAVLSAAGGIGAFVKTAKAGTNRRRLMRPA